MVKDFTTQCPQAPLCSNHCCEVDLSLEFLQHSASVELLKSLMIHLCLRQGLETGISGWPVTLYVELNAQELNLGQIAHPFNISEPQFVQLEE